VCECACESKGDSVFVCMSVRESERDIASVLVPASVSETVCVCVS
jgi:hypothetical protein